MHGAPHIVGCAPVPLAEADNRIAQHANFLNLGFNVVFRPAIAFRVQLNAILTHGSPVQDHPRLKRHKLRNPGDAFFNAAA
jgi:hypothetical protein